MTQCPRGLDCAEHRDVNTKFLSGYQVLKHGQDSSAAAAAAAAAFQERDLEVERMKGRVKDMAQIKYGVPYSVCMVLTWQSPLRRRAGQLVRSRHFDRFVHACLHSYMHARMHTCMYVCSCARGTLTGACMHASMLTCIHTHMHIHMYVCMYVCMHACSCAHGALTGSSSRASC